MLVYQTEGLNIKKRILSRILQSIFHQHVKTNNLDMCRTKVFIIPHMKILSRDWLTKVGHSIMDIPSCPPAKCPPFSLVTPSGECVSHQSSVTLTLYTDALFQGTSESTGSHCCFHRYFTKLGFVRYNKTNMPCQCGYPNRMDTHTGMAYLYKVHTGSFTPLKDKF